MSMYSNLSTAFATKRVGPIDIAEACEKGWITADDAARILEIKVAYSLDEAKTFKKRELSALCQKAIEQGIDVVLSDGESHHFSLSSHDQTNLSAKMLNLLAGGEMFEYHGDGEPCMYYNRDDMTIICMSAQEKVTIETTYYNCLVQWMNACKTSVDIMAIQYGMEIPEQYWSEPWRKNMELLAQQVAPASEVATQAGTQPIAEAAEVATDVTTEETATTKKTTKKKTSTK